MTTRLGRLHVDLETAISLFGQYLGIIYNNGDIGAIILDLYFTPTRKRAPMTAQELSASYFTLRKNLLPRVARHRRRRHE